MKLVMKKIWLLLFILAFQLYAQETSIELLSQFRGHAPITTYDIENDRLYLISGNLLEVFNLTLDNSFNKIGEYAYPVDNNSKPTQIYVKDNFLYSNNGNKGLWIIDVSDMETIRPRKDFIPSIAKWAQGFEVFENKIYMSQVIGYENSNILIADISEPLNIIELGNYRLPYYSENFSYRAKGSFLYIIAKRYSEHGYAGADLLIVNIANPQNPILVYQDHSSYRGVEIKNNFLFTAKGTDSLKIYDISENSNPKIVNELVINSPTNNSRNIDFIINKDILVVSQLDSSLNRKCWLFNLDTVYKPELSDSIILPYEINNSYKNLILEDEKLLTNKNYSLEYYQINNTKIDYKNKLEFAGEFIATEVILEYPLVYLLSDRGFYIIDITNVNKPFLRSQLKFTGTSFCKEDEFIYLSGSPDMRILNVSDVNNPYEIGYWDSYGYTFDIFVQNNYAFLAYLGDWQNPINGLKIIDVNNKQNPIEITTIDIGVRVNEIFADSNKIYVLAGDSNSDSLSGTYIFDVTNTSNINKLTYLGNKKQYSAIEIHKDLMFLAKKNEALQIYNISNIENPQYISSYEFEGRINNIEYSDNHLFLSTGVYGIMILNIASIENPIQVKNYNSNWVTSHLAVNENLLVSAEGSGGILLFEYSIIDSSNGDDDEKGPTEFNLQQNYPNPFNSTTIIKYSIPKQSNITLEVFDILGKEITTLVNKEQSAGNYEVEFNAVSLPSGIYFYRIEAAKYSETKKMILLR